MKKLLPSAALAGVLVSAAALHAQWKTETYQLKGGWNAIWLHGDATHATPAQLFADHPEVAEIWRWNPNPDQILFSASPTAPDATSSEWTIWRRDDPDEQVLGALLGQSAYLVRCEGDGTQTYAVPILQKPRPPAATWLIAGANFIGFPASTSPRPLFANYFASFPVAVAAPSKIYKYIGGPLNSSNPLQISASAEHLDRNTAYWFEAATVGDFTGPVEYEPPSPEGLAFGRSGNLLRLGVKNRTTSSVTLTFVPEPSEPAPPGQTGVVGPVPLTRRVFDSESSAYVDTPVVGSFSVTVAANGRLDVDFGIDRSQLGSDSNALFASFLRVKDSASLTDVLLPVSGQVASPAGLWIGQVDVDSVASTVPGSPGSTTPRPFPLRVIMHVDANGAARLLSQAFVGTLDAPGNPQGVATRESSLLASQKAHALRLVSITMPLDRVIDGAGTFAVGATLEHVVEIPFDDPVNPFVHAYHPDHDNRDARLQPLGAGVESYTIRRRCRFTFTSAPPDGRSDPNWGSTVYGGAYSETIEGLNGKQPLTVGGTFVFRRVSEIADLTLD